MSKGIVRRKKDQSINDRFSDDEANRRKSCHQLIEKEKQRKLNDLRKNQLGILQEILFNQRNGNKCIPKNNTVRNEKNHKTRPTSAKNLNSSDWNQCEEENEPVRLSRSQQHQTTHSQSHQNSNGIRSINNVSFMSDKSKMNASPVQFKKLLIHLSSELDNLESITGYKTNKNDLTSYTSSAALATALISLVGHVKQCASNSKEINNLTNQFSIVIKTQLNFQQKIENQITTLQTMMETIYQLINNDIISKKKFQISDSQQNWLNNSQKPYLIPKDTNNAMDELLLFTRQMNNASPINVDLCHQSSNNRHLAYIETLEASKKLTRPISGNDITKQTQPHRNIDQTLRQFSTISPIDMPLFEPSLSNVNSSASIHQIEPSASPTETLLEKILQERLRLVQQMTELHKQHAITQEELTNLESKTLQS